MCCGSIRCCGGGGYFLADEIWAGGGVVCKDYFGKLTIICPSNTHRGWLDFFATRVIPKRISKTWLGWGALVVKEFWGGFKEFVAVIRIKNLVV